MSTILLWLLKEVPCFRRRPSPNRHPPHSQITDLNTGADGFLFKTRVEKNTNHLALENPHSSARRFPLPSLKTISTLTPPIPISNYELCGAGFSPSLRSLPPAFFSNRTWANWRQKALSQARRAWSGVTRGALHLPVGGRRAFFFSPIQCFTQVIFRAFHMFNWNRRRALQWASTWKRRIPRRPTAHTQHLKAPIWAGIASTWQAACWTWLKACLDNTSVFFKIQIKLMNLTSRKGTCRVDGQVSHRTTFQTTLIAYVNGIHM